MPQGRNLLDSVPTTPPRVFVGFAFAIVTLLVVGGVTLEGLSRRTRDASSVERTFSVLRATEELVAQVRDSQLALTEFFVTGDHQFLDPFDRARDSIPHTLFRLREMTADRPRARQHLDELEPVLSAAFGGDAEKVQARRAGLTLEKLELILIEDKRLLDRSASLLGQLKDDTVLRLREEQRLLSESIRSARLVVIAGDAFLLALILAAAVLSLRDASAKARAVQFQRRVLGMVGHDLRNPLSVVTMSVTHLERHTAVDDRRHAAITRISTAATRMERMIRDLLDYSRIELHIALPLDIRSADVDASCSRIVDEFRAVHPAREIHYQRGDASDVLWDPDRIEQVLENLVGNALKYSPQETPVRVGWRRELHEIVIEVQNRGAPIPRALLPYIFEPFRRGANHDARTAKSSLGLGLYIAHHIVVQHGGKIDVESSEAQGTTFTVKLPQDHAPLSHIVD